MVSYEESDEQVKSLRQRFEKLLAKNEDLKHENEALKQENIELKEESTELKEAIKEQIQTIDDYRHNEEQINKLVNAIDEIYNFTSESE